MAEPGTITDEGVARLRERVGVPEPWPQPPHYFAPGVDAFRHVAQAYGDDNPLYCDPAYGEKTAWGGIIAPPPMVGGDTLIGEDEVTRVPEDKRDLMKGDPLRGVHAFYSASAREWWAPLRPDHRVLRRNALVAVLDKESEFAKRAIHEWSANVFRAEEGTILSGQYRLMIRTEREKARERGKYDAIEFTPYTDDEIEAIDEQYERQIDERRGAEPRSGRTSPKVTRSARWSRVRFASPTWCAGTSAWAWASTACGRSTWGCRCAGGSRASSTATSSTCPT